MALLQQLSAEQARHMASFQASQAPSFVERYKSRMVSLYRLPSRSPLNLATSPCYSMLWRVPAMSQTKAIYMRRIHAKRLEACAAKEEIDWEREEARWKREEQRWTREEQRWLREESRWEKERAQLKSQISQLEHERALLRASKYQVWPSSSPIPPPPASPRTIEAATAAAAELPSPAPLEQELLSKGILPEEVIAAVASRTPSVLLSTTTASASGGGNGSSTSYSSPSPLAVTPPLPAEATASSLAETNIFRSLKPGAEGDDVKALQDALMRIGFYSGEEEMELAFYDSGTASAVMSWQASIGAPEDGVVTPALFAQLVQIIAERSPANTQKGEQSSQPPSSSAAAAPPPPPAAAAAAAVAARSSIDGGKRMDEETPSSGASSKREDPNWKPEAERFARSALEAALEGTPHRVFLLGENRWEEPHRGGGRGAGGATPTQPAAAAAAAGTTAAAEEAARQPHKSCFQCKGAGRLICMDCDGTGEINVEEQFLEWVDGTECPYCDGNSFLICDKCEGTGSS